MKAVILAGGVGSRLAEETVLKPKPMVEVGGRPLLWHIMKIYSHHGINDFVICAGYKGYVIKEYFANYFLHTADVTFDMRTGGVEIHHSHAESWRVTVVDTGESTMTGGRLKIAAPYLGDGDFCMNAVLQLRATIWCRVRARNLAESRCHRESVLKCLLFQVPTLLSQCLHVIHREHSLLRPDH